MKFLSLDLSTNSGYAVFENEKLEAYGLVSYKAKNYKADVKKYSDLPEEYPYNFIDVADKFGAMAVELYQKHGCERVVIEHTEKGKQRLSQRLLEWINLAVVQAFTRIEVKVDYLLVSDWRSYCKCYLKYWPEARVWNAKIVKLKKVAVPTKSGAKIAKIDGKIVTKINQKKLSIILANDFYSLSIKDDNIADAINIGRAGWALLYAKVVLQQGDVVA